MIFIDELKLIEIELHSYCNRTCDWCPNSFIDRKSFKVELDEHVFKNLIDELASQGYDKYISFSRYNEPLSDIKLLEERVRYIRYKLPKVITVANTNGDFDHPAPGTIDELTVMDYDKKYNSAKNDYTFTSSHGKITHTRLTEINNRGGALKNIKKSFKRTTPCLEPQYFVGIDYNGDVTPCCNIRHDVPEHKPYILGNITHTKLDVILNSDKAKTFRKQVLDVNKLPTPCQSCDKGAGRYTRDNPGIYKK